MKTLILMRHASAFSDESNDLHRALSEKGVREAQETLKFLKTFQINKALCSSALRTVETFNIIQSVLNINLVNIQPELYNASEADLLEHILYQRDQIETLLVIAHNPSITNLAISLTNATQNQEHEIVQSLLPAQAIVLTFLGSKWDDLQNNNVRISKIFTPII
jgi:phosphohistidine phosphatase